MGDEAQYMFHARAILLQLWGAEHGFFTETTLDLQFHLEAWLLWGMGGGTLSMGISVLMVNTGGDDSGRLFRELGGYQLVVSVLQSRTTEAQFGD